MHSAIYSVGRNKPIRCLPTWRRLRCRPRMAARAGAWYRAKTVTARPELLGFTYQPVRSARCSSAALRWRARCERESGARRHRSAHGRPAQRPSEHVPRAPAPTQQLHGLRRRRRLVTTNAIRVGTSRAATRPRRIGRAPCERHAELDLTQAFAGGAAIHRVDASSIARGQMKTRGHTRASKSRALPGDPQVSPGIPQSMNS